MRALINIIQKAKHKKTIYSFSNEKHIKVTPREGERGGLLL